MLLKKLMKKMMFREKKNQKCCRNTAVPRFKKRNLLVDHVFYM